MLSIGLLKAFSRAVTRRKVLDGGNSAPGVGRIEASERKGMRTGPERLVGGRTSPGGYMDGPVAGFGSAPGRGELEPRRGR